MNSDGPLASVVVVNYEGREDLAECIPSLLNQTLPRKEYEVLIVDNDSTDGSVQFAREEFPSVKVVANDENRWYAGGNNDGLAIACGEYLAVLNPDVVVEPEWLETLLEPLREDDDVGLTTSRIMMHSEKEEINTCGNDAHFTGLGFCRGRHESATQYESYERVPAASGCSFAMSRPVYEEVGGFDEQFEFYYEDLDFSWRVRLAGYDILYVPDSVVYHKYERPLPPWRFFNMERNRSLVLLKHLRWRTLLAMLPALLLVEAAMLGYAAVLGRRHIWAKLRAWWWLVRHRSTVATSRRETQSLRRRSDAELLRGMNTRIPMEQFGISPSVANVVNGCLSLVFRPVYHLVTR